MKSPYLFPVDTFMLEKEYSLRGRNFSLPSLSLFSVALPFGLIKFGWFPISRQSLS